MAPLERSPVGLSSAGPPRGWNPSLPILLTRQDPAWGAPASDREPAWRAPRAQSPVPALQPLRHPGP